MQFFIKKISSSKGNVNNSSKNTFKNSLFKTLSQYKVTKEAILWPIILFKLCLIERMCYLKFTQQ